MLCNTDLWVKIYEIIATDHYSGIMECINDAMSIDGIKKKLPEGMNTLKSYFLYNFGTVNSKCYK